MPTTRSILVNFLKRTGVGRLVNGLLSVVDESVRGDCTLGNNVKIGRGTRIGGDNRVSIGDNTYIGENSFIVAESKVDKPFSEQIFNSKIKIGANVWITRSLHLYATSSVEIEDYAMLAANVFICDCSHGYEDAEKPYILQPFLKNSPIKIGRGAWIGQNCVILPGVEIGAQAIVGANSVVTSSIPEKSIAVGSPARIVKVWDGQEGSWKTH